MLNIILLAVPAVLAAAGAFAFAFAPALFDRSLSLWEDLLGGGLALIVAGCLLGYRKRQERKRLMGMRGSALW